MSTISPVSPAAAAAPERRRARSQGPRGISGRSVGHGAMAAAGMAAFYVAVVRAASGSWSHLADQAALDWYYLAAIMLGFGTQVALVSELRRRHRLDHAANVATGMGAGASTAGMIACCAHHLAELLPVIGAASLAGFLTDYRVPFMLTGIAINTIALAIAAHHLRRSAISRHACGG